MRVRNRVLFAEDLKRIYRAETEEEQRRDIEIKGKVG